MVRQLFLRAWLAAIIGSLAAYAAVVQSITTGSTVLLATSQTNVNPPSLPTTCAATSAPIAPKQKILNRVRTSIITVPTNPFALEYANNDYAFVALPDLENSTLGVLNTREFKPKLVHQVKLPVGFVFNEGGTGVTVSKDKKYVFVAAGPGAVIIDVARAITGKADAVVGTLNGTSWTPAAVESPAYTGPGFTGIHVALTQDMGYAFVSQEYGSLEIGLRGDLDVFKLEKPANFDSITGKHIGYLPLGFAVVGSVLSPDGKTLYATSEASEEPTAAGVTNGFISVIDVATLEKEPREALKGSIGAGCATVRAILSKTGKYLWATARESDLLLGYDTEKLVSDPKHSLIAKVTVGTAPVGLTFANDEKRILTADSNRFNQTKAVTGISVVDVEKALAGSKMANLGRIPTGLFPREFAVSPDGKTILVSDHDSNQVQAIDACTLP